MIEFLCIRKQKTICIQGWEIFAVDMTQYLDERLWDSNLTSRPVPEEGFVKSQVMLTSMFLDIKIQIQISS